MRYCWILFIFLFSSLQALTYQTINVITGQYCECETDPEGLTRVYDGKWHLSGSPKGEVEYLISKYQGEERIDRIIYPDGKEVAYTYQGGLLTRREDSNGWFLINEYDENGLVICQKGPAGSVTRLIYHPGYTEVYDALNHKKGYWYDQKQRITAIEHYLEKELYRVEGYEWENGQLAAKWLKDGEGTIHHKESYLYDSEGRVIQNDDGSTTTLYRYEEGLLVLEKSSNGQAIQYEYDGQRLIAQLTYQDGELIKDIRHDATPIHCEEVDTTTYRYDNIGNKIASIDLYGNETAFEYDSLGRLTKMIQPAILDGDDRIIHPITTYSYDLFDRITSITGPKKIVEMQIAPGDFEDSFINSLGQCVRQVWKPDGAVITFDAVGQISEIKKLNPFGETLFEQHFRYDRNGNKVRQDDNVYIGTEQSHTRTTRWIYGQKLEAVIEDDGQIARYTDQSVIKPDGTEIIYSYTPSGQIERQFSSDRTIDYHFNYDSEGRITSIENLVKGTLTTRKYKGDKLASETFENGLTIQYQENTIILPDTSSIVYHFDENHLLAVERIKETSHYIHKYTQYAPSGRLLESEMILDLGKITYDFDDKERCIAITSPHWSDTMTYNEEGLLAATSRTTYAYDALHQLASENGTPYHFDSFYNSLPYVAEETDLNGNLTKKDHLTLSYDALNRLTTVKHPNWIVNYCYDSFGRRLSKTKIFPNGQSETLRFLYDGENEIGAVNENGEIVELRILGRGKGGDIGAAVAIELEGNVYAPIHDQRGHLRCLVNTSQTDYTAFGIETHKGAVKSPWGYFSKRLDEETGFIFFGKRYYNPLTKRWITKDPLGTPDGPNRYAFCLNNPLSHLDLYGQFAFSDILDFFKAAYRTLENVRNRLDFVEYIRPHFGKVAEDLIGRGPLHLAGFFKDASETGIHGSGESKDKVRVTILNGVLNARIDYKQTIDYLSKTHGGINIHYVFDATGGWTYDVLKAIAAKFGFVSTQAYTLAKTWKELIQEMGGPESGGFILHYAHSIGGTHTATALNLLTPEEQKMINIITFGSATLIDHPGVNSVTNYISRRDGIPLFDPIGYLSSFLGLRENVVFVNSWLGIPFMDHMLSTESYSNLILLHGIRFAEYYALF